LFANVILGENILGRIDSEITTALSMAFPVVAK